MQALSELTLEELASDQAGVLLEGVIQKKRRNAPVRASTVLPSDCSENG